MVTRVKNVNPHHFTEKLFKNAIRKTEHIATSHAQLAFKFLLLDMREAAQSLYPIRCHYQNVSLGVGRSKGPALSQATHENSALTPKPFKCGPLFSLPRLITPTRPTTNLQPPSVDSKVSRVFRIGFPWDRIAQCLDDMAGQSLSNIAMSGHGLRHSCGGIAIPVVPAAMSHEDTTKPLDYSNQIDSLHGTTSSWTLRMPGNSPLVIPHHRWSSRCRRSSTRNLDPIHQRNLEDSICRETS